MPGKHTAKEKRQAKHIIAGYKKRGKDSETAKHIAWATVNKQKNESSAWMVSGSTSVFLGNPAPVSQFDPSSSTSPGTSYIPDEVAKQLVKESGLRKADTVSKKVIEGYLESMGLSRGLAVDVAKVLRDVYGITPTFDESLFAMSGNLIEELTGVLNESFPMPFAFDDEPRLLSEVEVVGSFLQREFMESTDENYDTIIGHLSLLSLDELYAVADFHEWVGADTFNQIEQLVINGDADIAEMVIEGLAWPTRIKLMPEHVQDLFDEDAVDDVIKKGTAKTRAKMPAIPPVGSKKPPAPAAAKKPGFQIPKIKAKPAVPSAKVQLRKHGQDLPGDALAAKKPGDALAKHREKQDREWGDKLAAAKARHADEPTKAVPKPGLGSKLKKAGSAALSVMKKIHTPSAHNPDVGPALKKIAGGAKKAAGKAATGVLGAIGHGVGALAGGLARGITGRKKAADSDDGGGEKKGLAGHLGHAIGKFAGHVKAGFKNATPGIQSQLKKGDDHEAEPKKKQVVAPQVGESTSVSGKLIQEVEATLSGGELPDDPEPTIRTPAEVVSEFKADTVVDMAVLEALAEMDWDQVAKTAGFMMLVPDRFLGLINAFKEGTDVFRAEWNELEESGRKPEWMNMGSFVTLSKLSLDEGVVPRIVYWAGMALQAADEPVASYVAESYPELGQTVYGPAGDPKEGPELAKAYMTPQPAGTMTPTKSDCTTRMFSDPAEREKARKAKLDDVMAVINGMKTAAAERGVPPEGMFLNLYRDMHRERVRYS
jgi:hypothetical protein